jgi:hypothetical protein
MRNPPGVLHDHRAGLGQELNWKMVVELNV